jgi:class 3 adenylate cyclase/alpha-beta hydrolase superfamily lysophospholipase
MTSTPETRYARTTDGTHVAYQVHGDGPIDIVMLRAWHSNLDHEWREPVLAGVYRRLGSVGRVIRLDRRGTGLSDRVDLHALPTIEDRVDDIRAVMAATGSERIVAIGLAHAAALCCVFAATHPERTAGLILWSPPESTVAHASPEDVAADSEELRAMWGTRDGALGIVRHAGPSRADDEALVEWVAGDERESGSAEDGIALWRLTAETNVDEILPTIHVPTLVAWREGAARHGPYVASRIPTATTAELPGIDHMLIAGDWRAPLAAFERFIDGLQDAGETDDRVLATVVFTDLIGSTETAARLGDAGWAALLERHHGAIRRELARHRGREIDTAGDGFFAAFDGPARAIRCAIAIRQVVEGLGLRLRIGLHAGECERTGGGLRGVAVHVGARIGASAQPGEILVSNTVRDLVAGSGIGFTDAGRHALKGVPDEWQLYRVTSA